MLGLYNNHKDYYHVHVAKMCVCVRFPVRVIYLTHFLLFVCFFVCFPRSCRLSLISNPLTSARHATRPNHSPHRIFLAGRRLSLSLGLFAPGNIPTTTSNTQCAPKKQSAPNQTEQKKMRSRPKCKFIVDAADGCINRAHTHPAKHNGCLAHMVAGVSGGRFGRTHPTHCGANIAKTSRTALYA